MGIEEEDKKKLLTRYPNDTGKSINERVSNGKQSTSLVEILNELTVLTDCIIDYKIVLAGARVNTFGSLRVV